MPIVVCPECSGQVSTTLSSCPHCGFVIVTSQYDLDDSPDLHGVSSGDDSDGGGLEGHVEETQSRSREKVTFILGLSIFVMAGGLLIYFLMPSRVEPKPHTAQKVVQQPGPPTNNTGEDEELGQLRGQRDELKRQLDESVDTNKRLSKGVGQLTEQVDERDRALTDARRRASKAEQALDDMVGKLKKSVGKLEGLEGDAVRSEQPLDEFEPLEENLPEISNREEIDTEVLGFWIGEWVVKETRTSRNGQSQEGPPARVVGRWKEKGKIIEERYFVEIDGRETEVRVDLHEYDPVQGVYIYKMNPFMLGGGEGVFHSRYDAASRTFNGELVSPKAPLPNMKLTRMFKQIGRDRFIYKYEVIGGPASGNVMAGTGLRVSANREKQIRSATPAVHDIPIFAFYSTSGTFKVYKLGEVIEQKRVNDHRDGSLRFMNLGNGRGKILGNAGTGAVQVRQTKNSISFIEVPPLGEAEHIFTVYDEWDPSVNGYRAVYQRSVISTLLGETMKTNYSGYARRAE